MRLRPCSRCLEAKPLSEFYPKRRKLAIDGLNNICIPCAKAKAVEWYKANPARHAASHKRWWEGNKPTHAKSVAKWAAANSAKLRSAAARRRARFMHAVPKWANHFFIEEIYDLARRRTKCLGVRHEVDHIVPLQSPLVCGLHVEHNLQVIQGKKNRSKANRYWPDMPVPAAEVRAQ